MKNLLVFLFSAMLIVSCGQDNNSKRKFKPTGTIKRDSTKVELKDSTSAKGSKTDTVIVLQNATITAKYPDAVSQILLMKRAYILEKENKPMEYYGDAFFKLFELETSNQHLINIYDSAIDSFIKTLAEKDDLNYENALKGNGNPLIETPRKSKK